MANKQRPVCYICVDVLFLFCLLAVSSQCADFLTDEYTVVDGNRADLHRFHVESFHPVRAKRQAPVGAPTSANSSSNEESHVTQATPTTATTTVRPAATGVQGDSNGATTTPAPSPVAPGGPDGTGTSPQGNQNPPLPPDIITDDHSYYMSTIIPNAVSDYFVLLNNPRTRESLNTAHRLAGVIDLPFTFRFYGHSITNVTVATGGFLYMSPFLHRFLASTQYIAPLMADFHTAASNDSNIFFQHIGDEFIIEWQQVMLKGQEEKGNFTFQSKLKKDGTITFVYKHLAVPVVNISSPNHPLKIGLSDAFYNDTHLPAQGIIRRRIIEYHRVVFGPEQVEEGTVIVLNPLPTCNVIEDCQTCAVHKDVKFDCKWCSTVGRCSDGLDWYRQDWETKGCKATDGSCRSSKTDAGVAAVVTVSVLVAILLVIVGVWVYYAYSHPTSRSGIWLMEHRPSLMRAKLADMSCCKKKPPASSKYAMESTA